MNYIIEGLLGVVSLITSISSVDLKVTTNHCGKEQILAIGIKQREKEGQPQIVGSK